MNKKIESFTYKNKTLTTEFIESSEVFPGVVCDVYFHPETKERDLGIIYNEGFSQIIEIGDIMQWQAEEDLVVFEICYPPYQSGRFENLADQLT